MPDHLKFVAGVCLKARFVLELPVVQGVEMSREFSGWGVIATGVLLALLGGYWLVAGWEHVQIERGWSQFIAGAVALSGGVITMAIGRLIRLLAAQPRVVAPAQTSAREAVKPPSERSAASAPESTERVRPSAQLATFQPVAGNPALSSELSMPQEPLAPARIETTGSRSMAPEPDVLMTESSPAPPQADWRSQSNYMDAEEPAEVDRYTAGDSTYVMYSDGSVEVRTPQGARRYESLDALRANSGER